MTETPAIKVFIDREYITNHSDMSLSLIEAYLLAVDCRTNDRIRFTVFLQSGAIWSGLPIEAIWCSRFGDIDTSKKLTTDELQPYSCLEAPAVVFSYKALKHANMLVKGLGAANYLFTINYQGEGFAEDPEQSKTHNIVVLEHGQLGAFPNNYLLVDEPWFTEKSETADYRRDAKFYFPQG